MITSIIGSVIVGGIVGALGRLILPGDQDIGWLKTIGLGVVSSFLVGVVLGGLDSLIISIVVSAIVAAGLLWVALKQGWLSATQSA